MADQYQTITVPGIGDLNFPSTMQDTDISAAIKKHFPEVEHLKETAAHNNAQRLSSAMNSFMPGAKAPTQTLPNPLAAMEQFKTANPQKQQEVQARQGFTASQQAGAREFNKQIEGTAAVGPQGQLLATTPFAPQAPATSAEVGSPLDRAMSENQRQQARKYMLEHPSTGAPSNLQGLQRAHQELSQANAAQGYNPDSPFFGLADQPVLSPLVKALNPSSLDIEQTVRNAIAPANRDDSTLEAKPPFEIQKGIARGALAAGEGATTPSNLALIGASSLAPEAGVAKLANTFFAGQMLYGAGKSGLEGVEAARRGDSGAAAEAFTGAGFNALFGGLGALHMVGEGVARHAEDLAKHDTSGARAQEAQHIQQVEQANTAAHPEPPVAPKPITAPPPAVETPKPVETPTAVTPPPKPQNPSQAATTPIVTLEEKLRGLAGNVLRIKQLSAAAKDRLNVEFALRQVQGRDPENPGIVVKNENSLADSRKNLSELSPDRQTMVKTVAKVLGTTPEALKDNNWRLTDEQHKQLEKMRAQGLRPFSLKEAAPEHPEVPFGEMVHQPLADINQANAKAAGIPNAKDLWAQASPQDRAEFQRRRQEAKAASEQLSGSQAAAEGMNVQGRRQAEQTGGVNTQGKDVDTLQFEHDAMQKVLAKRLMQAQTALTEALPAWRQARITETEPSKLAQQVNALGKNSKAALPKELYAQEHLNTKANTSAESTAVQEPISGASTAKGTTTPEASTEPQPKGQDTKVIEGKLVAAMNRVEANHGTEAVGGFSKLFDAVNAKYKTPENINTMMLRMAKKYEANLKAGIDKPLENVLDTLKGYPEEKPPVTLHANPLGVVWQKLFGARQTVNVMHPFPNLQGVVPSETITDFTKAVAGRPAEPALDQFKAYWSNETNNFVQAWREMPGTMKQRWNELDGFFHKVARAYMDRPGLSAVDLAMGLRNLRLNHISYELQDFVDTLKARHPQTLNRAAMTAWEEAGGGRMSDRDVSGILQLEANEFKKTAQLDRTHKAYAKIYQAAANLSDAEKQTVRDYRDYRARMEQRERDLGLQHEVLDDYIQHIWSRDNFVQNSIKGIQSGAGFGTTANFQRMRSYPTYFEGIHEGLKPNSLDMNYLITARAMASARVLANRDMVNFLQGHVMPDGNKAVVVEGLGSFQEPNPAEGDKKGAILIKDGLPKSAITPDGTPYQDINHAAFKNWKWVATAPDGTTVLYKGSMRVHPEIADQLKRILEPSALRGDTLLGSKGLATGTKALLGASSIGKQTLLIGLFHPVQLGVHMLEHAGMGALSGTTTSRALRSLNPFSTEKFVDLSNPKQQQLVVHGLQLRTFDAESLLDEGVMSRGFASGMPYMGGMWRSLHDGIFTKMIPNMKMAMAQDILERNLSRYHDTWKAQELKKAGLTSATATPDMHAQASIAAQSRIYRLTSEQTNAAFGGIDWTKMPVNKTGQDVLRLMVLAPDFLLARSQFVGDAFRPGGAESRNALGAGFAVQYVMARALNAALNDGDPKWDIHDWNKLIIGKHEYSLRTVQGDVVDSILDPRRFFSHRVNPLWRPAIEMATQKDVFGHPITAGQIMLDAVKNFTPMPLQGGMDLLASKVNPALRSPKNGESFADTFAQSMTGIMRRKYRTPAEREVFNAFDAIQGPATSDALAVEQKNSFNYLRDQYRTGKLSDDDISNALEGNGRYVPGIGKLILKPSEAQYLFRTKEETQLTTRARHLEPNQVLKAWDKGSLMEKMQLTPILANKLKTLPPELQSKISDKLEQFVGSLSDEKQEKVNSEIHNEIITEHPELQEEEQ